jgi:putative ABC transport system ATP-binding protein
LVRIVGRVDWIFFSQVDILGEYFVSMLKLASMEWPFSLHLANFPRRHSLDLIIAENLSKTYRTGEITTEALRGVSFSIDEGAFVSFVGPSGSGKTTLLNLVGCLDKPSSGQLLVAGMEVGSLDSTDAALFRGKHIGFIFQSFNLIPVLTVFENVEYPLVMVQNVPTGRRREAVEELLEAVGMTDQRRKKPDQLSGGQKQRVAIARALVTKPDLVLADEPTANLDHDTAMTIIRLMKAIRDRLRTTFVFSTHDARIIGEVESVFRLEDGRLKNDGGGLRHD